MFNIKDNAEWQLKMWLSSTGTALVLNDWEGAKFPDAPFLVVLNKRNADNQITKYETIEVEAINGDQMTIKTRWYGDTTPTDFSAGDFVSLFILSKHIEDLKTELTRLEDEKADKTAVAENLKGTPNSVLRFDADWNLATIPKGTQGQSLTINANWELIFGTAQGQVSYLSAKRELGEEIIIEQIEPEPTSLLPVFTWYTNWERTVSAKTEYNTSSYNAWRSFQWEAKNTNDYWNSANNDKPTWLQIQSQKRYTIKSFAITARPFSWTYAPTNFEFQWSNDWINWTILWSWENLNWGVWERKEFNLQDNISWFTYHRVYITSSNPNHQTAIWYMELFWYWTCTPKVYFLWEGTETEVVEKTADVKIGKNISTRIAKIKNNETKYTKLTMTANKIGNPTDIIWLYKKMQIQDSDGTVNSINWYYKKFMEYSVGMWYFNMIIRPSSYQQVVKISDTKTNEVLLEEDCGAGVDNSIQTYIDAEKNIKVEIKTKNWQSYESMSYKNVSYSILWEKICDLDEGSNIILMENIEDIYLYTEWLSSTNYWKVWIEGYNENIQLVAHQRSGEYVCINPWTYTLSINANSTQYLAIQKNGSNVYYSYTNLNNFSTTVDCVAGDKIRVKLPNISASANISYSGDWWLAGEYTLWFESWKKYLTKSNLSSRSKHHWLELTGGNIGDETTGIEGGIYQLPEGTKYQGTLYVQANGNIGTTPTWIIFWEGLGRYIKIL